MPGLRAWAEHSAGLHELRALRWITSCVFAGHHGFKDSLFFSCSIFGISAYDSCILFNLKCLLNRGRICQFNQKRTKNGIFEAAGMVQHISALHQPCLCYHCSVLGSDSEPTLTGSWLSRSQRPWIINDIRDFSKIGSDY